MKVIILAAGRGRRMKHLTATRPKCLLKLQGKSLLEWQIKALSEAGISDIAIVTGYKRELLSGFGLVEFYNPRWAETNRVSSLACAQQWLLAERCIVSYSDIFYEASAVKSLMNSESSLAVTFDPHWLRLWEKRFGDPLLDAETFCLNEDRVLTEIGNKPNVVTEIQGQFMGLLLFTPEGWGEILRIRSTFPLPTRDRMHMTGTLQKVIKEGRICIEAIPYEHVWGEVDSAEDLEIYQESGVSGTGN